MSTVRSFVSSRLAVAARVLVASHLLGACIPSFEDDQSLVEEARVLAVRSEPAEPRPGETVTLRALLALPDGEVFEPDALRWGLCNARKALAELGPVAPECIDDFGKDNDTLSDLGAGLMVETQIAGDACRVFGPLAPPPEPGSSISGRPVDPDSTGGFYQPIVLGAGEASLASVRLFCGAGTSLSQEENIKFNQGYRPNENPKLAELRAKIAGGASSVIEPDGGSLSVRAGARVELRASWVECPDEPVCGDGLCTAGENASSCAQDCRDDPRGCTGAELYLLPDLVTRRAVTEREELRVAWFATAGSFEIPQTGADGTGLSSHNLWTAPAEAQRVSAWIVLRDNRGGVDWREIKLEVTPAP